MWSSPIAKSHSNVDEVDQQSEDSNPSLSAD